MADPYIGEIRIMGFTYPPYGWATCNGQTLPVAQYQALFAVIGNIYGGDGVNNFMLPNLTGCVPMHTGQGTGLTNRVLAQQLGATDVTLTASQMAVHTHTLNAQNVTANLASPANAHYFAKGGYSVGTSAYPINTYSATMTPTPLSSSSIGATGGGQSHTNMQPFVSLNFCIALEGIYPVRP
jgi:microcystin-dependent protein